MSDNTSELILVRVDPTDREWISRAVRAVVNPDDVDRHREYQRLISGEYRGYTCAMLPAQADQLADIIFAASTRGGRRWQHAMNGLATRFRTERVRAVKAKSSQKWMPASKPAKPASHKYPCPRCANPVEPIETMSKTLAPNLLCVNCDEVVVPEGQA